MSRKRSSRDASQGRAQEPSGPPLPARSAENNQMLTKSPAFKEQREAILRLISAQVQLIRERDLNGKRRGELAELAFMLRAMMLEFAVCKPYGDSERYDCITDSREPDRMPKLSRVQVKCSSTVVWSQYHLNAYRRVRGGAVPYKLTEIDFFAVYIIPEDTWYIIPLADILGINSLMFRSKHDPRPGLYDKYREAWHLLRERDGIKIRGKRKRGN